MNKEKYQKSRRREIIKHNKNSVWILAIVVVIAIIVITSMFTDKEKFEKNKIENNYKVIIGNLVDNISEKYDLVVSNILVDVLIELLKNIEKTLEDGAIVIFSGILKEKEEMFLKETEKYNLKKIDRNEKNNWVSLVFEYKKIYS